MSILRVCLGCTRWVAAREKEEKPALVQTCFTTLEEEGGREGGRAMAVAVVMERETSSMVSLASLQSQTSCFQAVGF